MRYSLTPGVMKEVLILLNDFDLVGQSMNSPSTGLRYPFSTISSDFSEASDSAMLDASL